MCSQASLTHSLLKNQKTVYFIIDIYSLGQSIYDNMTTKDLQ